MGSRGCAGVPEAGAAAFKTLERFYGTDNITFTFISDEFNGITRDANGQVRPVVARTFHSFSEAAEENGQSRIYLGIHWAFDKTQGILSGNRLANFVFNNFLRPRTPGAFAPAAAAPLLLGLGLSPAGQAPVGQDRALDRSPIPATVPQATAAPASSSTPVQPYNGAANLPRLNGFLAQDLFAPDWFGVF